MLKIAVAKFSVKRKAKFFLFKPSFLFLFFCFSGFINAQPSLYELGYYNVRNYPPKEYDQLPQNWATIQDSRGVIYVANNWCIMEYNSVSWNSISTNDLPVRSLALDQKKVIYAGLGSDLGKLIAIKNGKLKFKSLKYLIPSEHQEFADVWKTIIDKTNRVVFQTSDKIFILKNNKISVVLPGKEDKIQNMFSVAGHVLLTLTQKGLCKLIDNKIESIQGGEFFANQKVYGMIEDGDSLLVLTRGNGFYKVHRSLNLTEHHPKVFTTDIDKMLGEFPVYNLIKIDQDQLSVGTLGGGIFIINKSGKLLKKIGKEEGLNDAMVLNQFVDQHKNLWLSTGLGLSRIEITSPLTLFNERGSLLGAVNDVTRFRNKIYAATSLGLFYLETVNADAKNIAHPSFKKVNGFNPECWSLAIVKDKLLIGTTEGLFEYEQNVPIKIDDGSINIVKASKFDDSRVFIGGTGEFTSMFYKDGKFNREKDLLNPNDEDDVYSIVEISKTQIAIGTTNAGASILQLKQNDLNQIELLDKKEIINSKPIGMVEETNQNYYLYTEKGLFNLLVNNSSITTNQNNLPEVLRSKITSIHRLKNSRDKKLWIILDEGKGKGLEIGSFELPLTASSQIYKGPFKFIRKEITQSIFNDDNKITWLGGTYGLYRFDENPITEHHKSFKTIITNVIAGKDSALFKGNWFNASDSTFIMNQTNHQTHSLPFKLNSMLIHFAALNYEHEHENLYSSYLEGNENSWSDWKKTSYREYTYLHEGKYIFHVKSKNIFGYEGQEASYVFQILPPWYRTWWAYVLYVFSFGTFVYGAIVYTTRGLRAIIRKQTIEVVRQKEEIEKKNKDITDSIHYARKIQAAILPSLEDIMKALPQSFVLFKPRDVVSGDFYWFSNIKSEGKNLIIIAAADCTGHGVPGALMSMVGNTILNEIVITNKVVNPSEILENLHLGVRHALKQHETESRDGMDIAICCIDFEGKTVKYAGANRPLWRIVDSQLTEIKATKAAIGGLTDTKQHFELNTITFQTNDWFYIFSDGYADQFGGTAGKKYMTKKFKETLLEVKNLSPDLQRDALDSAIEIWRGDNEQVDDILVIGIKF